MFPGNEEHISTPWTPYHRHTLSVSLSTGRSRSTTESTLYLLLRFRSRVPFAPSHPPRAGCSPWHRTQEPRRQQRNNSFPYGRALSPLFIYRSFVERDDRGDRARIPPSSNEAKELRSTIRGQDPRGSG